MRLVQYWSAGRAVAGLVSGARLTPLTGAPTLLEVLRLGQLDQLCKQAKDEIDTKSIPLSSVKLLSPITGGDKVIGVGLNYSGHCLEQNLKIPEEPIFFGKFPGCIIGPNEPVLLRSHLTKSVDWEVELAVIIGKEARDVSRESALDYVVGYTIAQDISARDWQKKRNGGQFLLGKSMDTFCPLGPELVTRDEIPDPHNLSIQCSINGELKQKGNTNELIYRIDDVIQRLSSMFTLLPGDVILTGTPSGVGCHRTPPEFLQPGDTIVSQIESIGTLTSPVALYSPAS